MSLLAFDVFNRTSLSNLGTSDSGHLWSQSPTAGATRVDGGVGIFENSTTNRNVTAALAAPTSENTDVTVTITLDAMPIAGNAIYRVIARTAGGLDYHARLSISPAGAMSIGLYRADQAVLGSIVGLSGAQYTAGTKIKVRVQAMGKNPTTVRTKVWYASVSEPNSWTITATDSTAEIQAAGVPGFRASIVSTVTNLPFITRIDDYMVTDGVDSSGGTPEPSGVVFQLKRAMAAVWASKNPILADGEPGIESDTRVFKIGDGVTPWNALGQISGGPSSGGGTGGGGVEREVFVNGSNIVDGSGKVLTTRPTTPSYIPVTLIATITENTVDLTGMRQGDMRIRSSDAIEGV